MNISDYKGVLVFVEQRDRKVQKVSLELIGKAREMADQLEEKVMAVILGSNIKDQADLLIAHGADKVIYVEAEALDVYMTEPYTKAIYEVIKQQNPEIVLFGATAIGRDLAPRVSARIGTGLTADCTSLEIEDETKGLLMTRPAFGGNIMATIICPEHRPQMSTVRPGVMKMLDMDATRKGEIEEFKVTFTKEDINVEILETVKEEKEKINIEDADVLISGGRGVGKPESFEVLKKLAGKLHGCVAASRGVVDAGLMDRDYQVGQTGKTVRPNLYIACGISGAIQHLAGMEESDFIVAINKDPGAPIFEVADIGIVGDANKVIPALIDELELAKDVDYMSQKEIAATK